ncbi:MAG TPA: bifunctional phosphoribosylaminoimidazolecarboxamide formyltransferase/IMP cyclohydrolase [Acidimicrobiales bacterium]|nr:bifunctional phosphoribosylaminoimidazolecarboxamide formyltransferase/IMP cyclohydrolase [Acidimicrobiales bacterium]
MRAFLSVYDKTGVVDLATGLTEAGWELLSSGGTAHVLREAGVEVTDTETYTGYPAILGHRVMTLHPKIHGGILADPTDPDHRADMAAHDITMIDLVVANLYPFGSDPTDFAHGGSAGAMDLVDIGGPAMIRAAAKNHAHVAVVVDPVDYPEVLDEARAGAIGDGLRRTLARKAFATTAAYDAAIVEWLDTDAGGDELPATYHLALEKVDTNRYGENPHQRGARYRRIGATSWLDDITQHSGLALSYLNLFDTDAAWRCVHDLGDDPAVVVVKHANPCGVAVGGELAEVYQRAYDCDSRSAFGGIVSFNRTVDAATVERMVAAAQADVVIAPGYDDGVVDALIGRRKNTRILTAPVPSSEPYELRQIGGGYLLQDAHSFVAGRDDWRVVTERRPTDAEWADVALAWRLVGWVKSNAIVLVKDRTAWGIGAGQQNRVESGLLAATKADGRAVGGACASDAFYPFADGIEAAASSGVAVVIQPGGAMRDDENIAKANELGLAMVFTGERHFLH